MSFHMLKVSMAGLLTVAIAAPLAAQQMSASHDFLQAVRDADGKKVTDMLDRPGSRIIDTHDYGSGEGALHITVRRGDTTYTRFLLQKGADPNIQDNKGVTPLLLAVSLNQQPLVEALLAAKADPNIANSSGETPLIRAVQMRNPEIARVLLAAGADPDKADLMAGRSARDYALADTRTPALAQLFKTTPKRVRNANVAGPHL